jgi:hypothetical protein
LSYGGGGVLGFAAVSTLTQPFPFSEFWGWNRFRGQKTLNQATVSKSGDQTQRYEFCVTRLKFGRILPGWSPETYS